MGLIRRIFPAEYPPFGVDFAPYVAQGKAAAADYYTRKKETESKTEFSHEIIVQHNSGAYIEVRFVDSRLVHRTSNKPKVSVNIVDKTNSNNEPDFQQDDA